MCKRVKPVRLSAYRRRTRAVPAVAQQAGVSKQTVYSHFGCKDDLFTAAIRCKCDRYNLVDLLVREDGSLRERLLDIDRHFIQLILSEEARCVHRTCVAQVDTQPQAAALFLPPGLRS